MVARYGAERAYYGGLQIHTTLDLGLQRAAEQAIAGYLPGPEGPTAALVAIENSTGKVRAMVGGRSYDESPFNLATEGERQPGSSFKAFDLAAALEDGISPDSVWTSKEKEFIVPGTNGHEKFVVHNDEGAYWANNADQCASPTRTTRSSRKSDCGSAPAASPISPTGWESRPRSRPIRR